MGRAYGRATNERLDSSAWRRMAAFGREAWRPWGAGRLAGVNSGENGRREAETGNVGDAQGSFKNLPPSLLPSHPFLASPLGPAGQGREPPGPRALGPSVRGFGIS